MILYHKQNPENTKTGEIKPNSYCFTAISIEGEPKPLEVEKLIEFAVKNLCNTKDRKTTYHNIKGYINKNNVEISDKYQTMLEFLLSPWSEKDVEAIFWERLQKMQHPLKPNRLYFVPCKCLMWLGVVDPGDFHAAAEKIHEHIPNFEIKESLVKDLSKLDVQSFSKTHDKWTIDDAPVKSRKSFHNYKDLAEELIRGLL